MPRAVRRTGATKKGRRPRRRPAAVDSPRIPRRKTKPRRAAPAGTYHIPETDEVLEAIQLVLGEKRTVKSQHELAALVVRALKGANSENAVTERRVRHVALSSDEVTVDIEYREVAGRRAMSKCPVCGGSLRPFRNETIYGGEVTLGFECQRCPYQTGLKHRVPTRYTFHFRRRAGKAPAVTITEGGAEGAEVAEEATPQSGGG